MSELHILVEAAQQGDLSAFGQIVTRFQDMAFAIGYDRLGNAQQAEDVAQEAFLECYVNLSKLNQAAAFPGWFRTIVQRQCSRVTRRKALTIEPLDSANELPTTELDPSALAQLGEMRQRIHATIQGMSDNERQVTLLYYIADYSQQEIADILDVRVSTVKSRLHTARTYLRERMIEMVQENLQEQRPSKDEKFASRVMDIIQATEQSDLSKLKALLKREPELAKTRNATGRTLLHIITEWPSHKPNRTPMIKLLLQAGADPNARFEGEHRETPLHWAASADDVEAIDALLDGGAEIDADGAVIREGTPLTDAVFFLQLNAAQRLIERGATVNLPLAAGMGRLDLMQEFFTESGNLKKSAKELCPSDEPQDGVLVSDEANRVLEEAFAYACLAGQVDVARFLLERGVDVNSQTLDEHSLRTGLHWAVYRNQPEMVRFLIEKGADLTVRDQTYDATPRDWAIHHELSEVEDILASAMAQRAL